jgi:GAF domain-containing protein
LSVTEKDELTGEIKEESLPKGFAGENIKDIPSGVLNHYLAVPITFNNKTIGVIRAVNKKSEQYDKEKEKTKSICLLDRGFSEDCQTELEITASHLAATIKNAELIGKQSELVRSLALLNETGQLLTRRLDSREVLQDIVHQIKGVTKADLIILYPFVAATKLFQFPRCSSGSFLSPEFPEPAFSRPDDIASLTLKSSHSIFATNSRTLLKLLGGEIESRKGRFQEREKIESTAAVPLLVREEPVGVLFVNFRVPQPFDDPQRQFIEGLAHYAAIAIKNSRVYGDLQSRHVRELELLQTIDSEISKTLELESILGTILKIATEQIHADDSSILLYNDRNETLEPKAVFGRNFDLRKDQVISLDDESRITLAAFKNRIPIRVDNVKTDPKWKHLYYPIADDVLSELDVPLMAQETAIGVINMESVKEKAFNQLDVEFLSILANRAVMAIKNAQAYEREQRISRELEAMFEISEQIIDQTDPRKICDLILEKALDVTNSAAGNLMLYDPQRNDLWMAAEGDVDKDKRDCRQEFGEGIVGQVAETRKLLNVPDVLEAPWSEGFVRFIRGTRSELAVPIVEGEKVWGVINIESPIVDHFTKADERLLTALANTSVIALQNAERLRRMKKRETQLLSLRDMDQRIVSQLDDPDQVMQAILEGALIQTETGIGYLHLYEDGVIKGTYYAHKNDDGSIVIDKDADAAETLRGFVAYVAANHESYLVAGDAQDHPLYKGDKDIHSQMAATLLSGTEVLGVLTVQSRRLAVFDQEAEEALNILVRQAVIAIQNARNYARAEKELQRFSQLYNTAWELAQITDPAEIAKAYDVVLWSADLGQESQALICRYDEESQELEIAHSLRLPLDVRLRRPALDEGVNGQVARTRKPIVVYDTEHLPEGVAMPITLDLPVNSLVVIPLEFGSRYYGNLALSHGKGQYFKDADVELMQGLAKQLAITIYRLETAEARHAAEQRAIEAEVMSSLGQSTFELSHRLGNDLGLVRSYVQSVRATLASNGIELGLVDKDLNRIVEDVAVVLRLSRGLKQELAGLRDGTEAQRVSIRVRELFQQVTQSYPGLPANVEVRFEISNDVQAVTGIPGQVLDALRNLFFNAVEAMPEGGRIVLGARNAGEYVKLEITDAGPGIKHEQQARIFDLFYSTKGSSGFGLWSARRTALANGGDLTVISELGHGTTFILLLPRANLGNPGSGE